MPLRGERQYADFFVRNWGHYFDPYLGQVVDLRTTFIPASFWAMEDGADVSLPATEVLARRPQHNVIIDGFPGAGKSTLLKLYGIDLLTTRRRSWLRRRTAGIPFLVQLRKLARYLGQPGGDLAQYLIDEILTCGARMKSSDAAEFLQSALRSDRVVVLLDGIDDIPADRYRAVLEAVLFFAANRSRQRPTYAARLIVTCRRQNFLSVRDDWLPLIAERTYTLAPLRDDEIRAYLEKFRSRFATPEGPERFLDAMRASGALEMLRIPLMLAVSVGVYAGIESTKLPFSIGRLYETVIEEMLGRRQFGRDPPGQNLFLAGDKYRFLREFALAAAVSPAGFGDFGYADLLSLARQRMAMLSSVTDAAAFVDEIIHRSGLLVDVSDADEYVFAHRTIQEYLVAEELSLLADGDAVLLGYINDREWRNVIVLYVALAKDTGQNKVASRFLASLQEHSFTLAGHCLRFASVDHGVAKLIVDRLARAVHARDDLANSLAALHSASSPPSAVQALATRRMLRALDSFLAAGEVGLRLVSAANASPSVRLLHKQLAARTEELTAAASDVLQLTPSAAGLVETLWRWLAVPGADRLPVTKAVVARLLELVRDEQFRNALDDLPPANGESDDGNYRALIRWAERLHLTNNHAPWASI